MSDIYKKIAESLRTTPVAPVQQTQLPPRMENLFQMWATTNNVPQSNDYDMRGFYMGKLLGDPSAMSQVNASDNQLHFSDKWKLPNHKSFSNESQYSRGLLDPRWVENPAPYKEGTWGLLGGGGYKKLEIAE
jgi:hypothetical protein